jgi:hypothetical protein
MYLQLWSELSVVCGFLIMWQVINIEPKCLEESVESLVCMQSIRIAQMIVTGLLLG